MSTTTAGTGGTAGRRVEKATEVETGELMGRTPLSDQLLELFESGRPAPCVDR